MAFFILSHNIVKVVI